MVTLKINNSKNELVASEDIDIGSTIFVSSWSKENTLNPFYLPKLQVEFGNKDYISTDDFVEPVALNGFGEYIRIGYKNSNINATIDFDNKNIKFTASRNIKKNEVLTYNIDSSYLPNVKIQ